jgi:polar amino acid transport system permease protein
VAPSTQNSGTGAPHLFVARHRRFGNSQHARWASIASTLTVIGVLALALWMAPGGKAVREFFLSPSHAWRAFIGDPSEGLSAIWRGFLTNIWMFIVCEILVLIFGLAIAVVRMSSSPVLTPLRLLSTIYTDFFRGIPVILVLFAVGYGMPGMDLGWISQQSPAVYACIALTITYSAYVAEVYRAGINSVATNQLVAARAIGLRQGATMRYVVLPQAIRNVIPPLLNDFISLQKDTALVSTLGIVDATQAAHIYGSLNFNFAGYTVASLLFLLLTIPMTRLTDRLIDRDRSKRLAFVS